MTRIWLIRHAASTSPPGLVVGVTDPPLSSRGRLQADRLAADLADRPLVAVWSSDSSRAAETAARVAEPHRLKVEVTPALREIDYGAWEGRDLTELWAEDPQAARAWETDLRQTPRTFGENVSELERRVRVFWRESCLFPVGGEIAIVAHRGSLAALRSILTGRSFAECFAAKLDLGGLECIDVTSKSESLGDSRPLG